MSETPPLKIPVPMPADDPPDRGDISTSENSDAIHVQRIYGEPTPDRIEAAVVQIYEDRVARLEERLKDHDRKIGALDLPAPHLRRVGGRSAALSLLLAEGAASHRLNLIILASVRVALVCVLILAVAGPSVWAMIAVTGYFVLELVSVAAWLRRAEWGRRLAGGGI